MASTTLRQDKTRRILAEPETVVGTFESFASGGGRILPALDSSRVTPQDVEDISQSEALDGFAGEVASTRGAAGMGVTIACEMRDYSGDNAFPPWVIMLLGCGFEATHSDPTLTLIPSTKAVADWPGESAGARSPCSLSVAEALLDNGTADELVPLRGGTGSAKIMLATNGRVAVEATLMGQVVGSEFLDLDYAGFPDLSAYGTRVPGESVNPIVVKSATLVVNYVDDSGATLLSVDDFRELEIDMGFVVDRVVDPEASEGYAPTKPFAETAPAVTLKFADTASLAEDIMAGYFSGRGFLSIVLTLTLDSGTPRNVVITIPRVQYEASREALNARRMFAFTGKAVRAEIGNATSPVTIAYTYKAPP